MSDEDEDTYTVALAKGIKTLLETLGWPVKVGPIEDEPGAALGITPYAVADDDETGTILTGVQVRIRGTAQGGNALMYRQQDRIRKVFSGMRQSTLNGLPIAVAWRQLSAPLGLDAQGRPVIADTYYLRSDRAGYAG